MATKPRVLVLGGAGFLGRSVVNYLVENDCCSYIRVADKQPIQNVVMSNKIRESFSSPKVEVLQTNLCVQANVSEVFNTERFDVVFNTAGETRYGQPEEAYRLQIVEVTTKCAQEAATKGCGLWIEVSTGQVYDSDKKNNKEDAKLKPWTKMARYKLQAEEILKATAGLQYVILRPAIIYGPGDVSGLAPRLVCGAVYKHINKKMKLLWGGDLRINTVHVRDTVRAMWHVATTRPARGTVFNLVDKGDTDQRKINDFLEELYGIKTTFYSKLASKVGTLKLSEIAQAANEQHMGPWVTICKQHNMISTPLSPYTHKDLLKNHNLSLDGTAIEATGFQYTVPQVTAAGLREALQYWIDLGQFPSLA